MLVHHAGEVGHQQRAAHLHIGAELVLKAAPEHEQHGRNDQLVAAQVGAVAHVAEINAHAHLPQAAVVHVHRIEIAHVPGHAGLGIINGPAVVHIIDDADLRPGVGRVVEGLQALQGLTYRRHIPEHAGIVPSVMIHHRAVEHLRAAPALAPLEIHHALAAVGHRLQRGQQVHAGALELVDGLPVHQGGGGFHQQEGLILVGAHQVVVHGELGGRGHVVAAVPGGVAVPGHHVHALRQVEIVVVPEALHQVGGAQQAGLHGLHGGLFSHHEGFALPGGEAPPVHPHGGDAVLAHGGGSFHLAPVGVAVAPEAGPPAAVQLIQRAVLVLQPLPPLFLAQRAAAVAGIFVAQVPQNHCRMLRVALGQGRVDVMHLLPVHWGGEAVVVTGAEVVALKLLIHAQHLGILLRHPRRARAGGRGQNHMDAALPQPVNHLVQPSEVIYALLGLQ